MRPPLSPINLLLFVFIVVFLLLFLQVGLISVAFDKLGLSQSSAFLLLMASLGGSAINLPLFTIHSDVPPTPPPMMIRRGPIDAHILAAAIPM